MTSVLDILGLSSIAGGLQVGTRPTDFSFLLATDVSTIVPMSVFVILAGVGIFFVIAKAYHDTVISMVNVAPKIVTLIYILAAWTISVALVYMSYWIGHLTVVEDPASSELAKYLFLENISVQFLRWSFVLGAFLMSYGPLLLLPPYERQASIKDHEDRAPQSKLLRYSMLTGFILIALFQLFLSFEWVILLTYSPWFAMSMMEGLCVGLCYMFVSLFYLYCGWYAVVKNERKEDALLSEGLEKASILRRLRAAMSYAKRSSRCSHGVLTQCATCRKKSFLGTQTFLITYSISFAITLLASTAEQAYFWWFDLTLLLERSAILSFSGIVTIAFGAATFLIFAICTVILFNRAYRANKSKKIIDKRKSIAPGAADPLNVKKTNELTEEQSNASQPRDGSYHEMSEGPAKDFIAVDVNQNDNTPAGQFVEQQGTSSVQAPPVATAPNYQQTVQENPVPQAVLPAITNNRSSLFQPVPSQDSLPRISAPIQSEAQQIPAPPTRDTLRKSSTISRLVNPKQNTLPYKRADHYATVNPRQQSMTMRSQKQQQFQQQQLPFYSEQPVVREPTIQSMMSQIQTDTPGSNEDVRNVAIRNSDSFYDVFQSIPMEQNSIPEQLNNDDEQDEQSLSAQDIRNIIQWLETSERISIPRGTIKFFSQQKPELIYEELVTSIASISPAIFAHLDCWLLARIEKDMDQLEEMIASSTPETFSPQLKNQYPGVQAVGKFKELFANMFPNINSELLDFDPQFRSAQDVFLFLMCLHVLMNYS